MQPDEVEAIVMEESLKPEIINPFKNSVSQLIGELAAWPIAMNFRQLAVAENLIKEAYNMGVNDALTVMKEESTVIYGPGITKIKNLMKDRS